MTDAPPPTGDGPAPHTAVAIVFRKPPPRQHVVAIVFDKPTRADEVLLALAHLQMEGGIEMDDAVVVAKTAEGKTHIRQTVDITPGKAAVGGLWLGTFVGLLFGGPLGGAAVGA